MVAGVVGVSLWEKYRVSAGNLHEISAVYAKPTLATQNDVKDSAAGKIDMQTPWRAQLSAAENDGLQRDRTQDLGYKIVIYEVC